MVEPITRLDQTLNNIQGIMPLVQQWMDEETQESLASAYALIEEIKYQLEEILPQQVQRSDNES